MADLEPEEEPTPYRLSNEPPPKRRYRPMKGFRASSEREPNEFDKPAWKRFFGSDPFPWALAVCVLLWVGLGLATRREPLMAIGLVVAGLAAIVLSHVWMLIVLWEEDESGVLGAAFNSFYHTFYMYNYADVIWRQLLLSLVGGLMILTAMGLSVTRALHG